MFRRLELKKQKDLIDAIRLEGGLARLCVQTPYTIVGDPDIYGCWRGRMFQIEYKEEGHEPTDIQQLRLQQWKYAGAKIKVVHSMEEGLKWLNTIRP